MESQPNRYSRRVSRMLEDEDLAGLLALLRQPAQPELRGEAALALGDLGNYEATELLVRATNEDPDPQVRGAARRALGVIFGGEANSVIASYSGTTPPDAWLIEPEANPEAEEGAEEDELKLDESELDGVVRLARHETNEAMRLEAIGILGHNHTQASTDILADLALWGDNSRIREAAQKALENLYGDDSTQILENYRTAALREAHDFGDEEQLLEDMTLDDDETGEDEGEEEEERADIESVDEEWEDEDEDEEEVEANAPNQPSGEAVPAPTRSEFQETGQGPVSEEVGRPWTLYLGLIVLGLIIVIYLLLTNH